MPREVFDEDIHLRTFPEVVYCRKEKSTGKTYLIIVYIYIYIILLYRLYLG